MTEMTAVHRRLEIKNLQRRLQTTVVYVTHDQVEAMTMADRVAVMNKGVIEQLAGPITLYEEPANQFVAAFIGAPSMNFLAARVVAEKGGLNVLLDNGASLPIPADRHDRYGAVKDRPVTFGLRPEHMTGGASGPAVTTVTPWTIEPLGPHTLVVGDLAGTKVTTQVDAHYPCQPEQPTQIMCDMSKMHLFDAETGRTL